MVEIASWAILAMIGAVAFSGMTLLYKTATERGVAPMIGLFYILIVATVILGGYVFVTEKSFAVSSNMLMAILVAAGVLSVTGNILAFKAISAAPNAGYADAMSSLRIVIVTLVSVVLFGLQPNWTGIAGVFLVAAGAVLLSVGV